MLCHILKPNKELDAPFDQCGIVNNVSSDFGKVPMTWNINSPNKCPGTAPWKEMLSRIF